LPSEWESGSADYASFVPSAADYGAVALFTIVWTMLMVYALLREGIMRSARGVLGPFGAPASARSNARWT